MQKYILLFLGIIFSLNISAQAYFSESLEQIISQNPKNIIPVIIKLKKQRNLKALEKKSRNISKIQQQKIIVQTLLRPYNNKNFDDFLSQLQKENSSELKDIHAFNLVNVYSLKASATILKQIVENPEVDFIQYDYPVVGEKTTKSKIRGNRKSRAGIESGLIAIHVRELWAMGYTGKNRIAMNIDTGVEKDHPALKNKFLGEYLPLSQTWYGYEHNSPYDIDRSHFHGTHTMGTMIGLDSAAHDTIGIAFNAVWIASDPIVTRLEDVRPMSEYFKAFEWALNPDGDTNTVTDIPDVINNSWGVSNDMWPDCHPIEYDFIKALELANCAVIFSAGNDGPDAETIGAPAFLIEDSLSIFSVGALDAHNSSYPIASFSSRGPSPCAVDSPLNIKPEVAAPGVDVRSASGNGEYMLLSGTSMAGPHVAGSILLLREAFPTATSTELKNALYQTATDLGEIGEDNTYGRGLINVYAAYQFLANTYTPTPPVSKDYDIAIDTVIGKRNYTCQQKNTFIVQIKNTGNNSISDLKLYCILNEDTIEIKDINETINPNTTKNFTFSDISLKSFDNSLTFHIYKDGISEYDIYNNYRTLNIKYLKDNNIPYKEDFEHNNFSEVNMFIINPDIENTWEIDSTKGIDNSYQSLKMPFAYYTPKEGQKDYLLTGAFNIPNTEYSYLIMQYAYSQYFSSREDSLFILVSEECKENIGDTVFADGGGHFTTTLENTYGDFYPKDETEWKSLSVDLTKYAGKRIFIQLIAKNDGSNNLFIDNFSVVNGAKNSILSAKINHQLKFYPNPANTQITFTEDKNGAVISIYNIAGEKVLEEKISSNTINISKLKKGIYFIRIENEALNGKLIVI